MKPDSDRGAVARRGALLWLVLSCLGSFVWADEAPSNAVTERAGDLLSRMSEALRSLSYEGTLVYSHENRIETLHLAHRVADGRIEEHVVALSGPLRAVTRGPDELMCILPQRDPISIKRQGAGAGLFSTGGIDPAQLVEFYRIELPGMARVAGRETEVVGIVPRDALRYGYRFYIDQQTSLPLKSDLIDLENRSLEQLMFTSISVEEGGEGPSPGAPSPAEGIRAAEPVAASGRWAFDERPRGFQLVRQGVMQHPDGTQVEHFLFTDRLSAYSIYVETDPGDGLAGATRIGAVNATGRRIERYQMTAVGEVPAATLQAAILGARLAVESAP